MDWNEFAKNTINAWVNQSLINQENTWRKLPPDQEDALNNMLKAFDLLMENKAKISPEYQQQVFDALVIKVASKLNG